MRITLFAIAAASLISCQPVRDPGDVRTEARIVLELARTEAEPLTLAEALGIGGVRVPTEIRVWRRAVDGSASSCEGRVDVLPLEDYVGGVLPEEWPAYWDMAALEAGAIAVRTYAAFWVGAGGRYQCADLDDSTWSQVYTDVHQPSTDEAVANTEGVVAVIGDSLVYAEYSAENGASTALGVSDPVCGGTRLNGHGYGVCQWGTQRWAQQGRDADWMIQHYYPGARARWPDEDLLDGVELTVYSGERFRLSLTVSNDDKALWPRRAVGVGTEPSAFADPSWPTDDQPKRRDRGVPPGATATVRWWMTAPEVDQPMTYAEFFYLDGPASERPGSAGTWHITVLPAVTLPEPVAPETSSTGLPMVFGATALAALFGGLVLWRARED